MVDIQRKKSTARRWVWRTALLVLVLAAAAGVTLGLSRLEPAVPTVDTSVRYGTVNRGTLVREVAGRGPLVPVDVTIVTSEVGGQVVALPLEPGVEVDVGAVLMVMQDLTIERNLIEAQRSLKAAESERDRYKLLLEQQELDLRATTAQARANWEEARSEADMKGQLADQGLISAREDQLARTRADRTWTLLELQVARVENSQKTSELQLQEKEAAVERAKDVVSDRQRECDALAIRATTQGILQELGPALATRWEVGQRIAAGARVAKITDPQHLKAVLQVTDVQAREVMTGQPVTIDTHSALIAGRVVRVDPAVKEGKVAVDVVLAGELPAGARPDLEVYGKIEIERLDDVLQLSPRPGLAETDSTISLFRVAPAGEYAERTTVRLGRGTLGAVEVREGLQAGDRVIVSDMRRYDDVDRVLLPAQ